MHLSAATCAPLVPVRDAAGHKGSFGTLVCVCGSLDYAGAALLCGIAAARAGAGLVCLAVPRSLQPVVAGRVPELVTLGLPEIDGGRDIDAPAADRTIAAKSAEALVVGCGLNESEGYRLLVLGLIGQAGPPMVVDGGALNLLSRIRGWWSAA